MSLLLALPTLVAIAGLLQSKRCAYYLCLALGVFLLIQLGLTMLATPDKLFYLDWKFDLPDLVEWILTLGWVLYLLRSRRVYSVLLADPDDVKKGI